MSDVTVDQLVYMTHLAQKNLGRMNWTDIATDLQEYKALPKLLNKERVGFQSGTSVQGTAMTDTNGSARSVGLYGVDSYVDVDGSAKFDVPWAHQNWNWSYDRRIPKMGRGVSAIVDIVKFKRTQAMLDLAVLMEDLLWTKPADSSDTTRLLGIPYWAVQNSTEGFNGGNPAGFSGGAGGIDSTAQPRWANYTFEYANITEDDCVTKMRRAFAFTRFMPAVPHPSYDRGSERRVIYMDYDTIAALEKLAKQQNDRLGFDVAPADGRTMFHQVPMEWVPYLQENTTNQPIYFIDWSVFYIVFLEGEYLVEGPAEMAPNQHTVIKSDGDCTCNTRCHNRRRLAVGRKAA